MDIIKILLLISLSLASLLLFLLHPFLLILNSITDNGGDPHDHS